MAKNFPYFKFTASEWLTGDIVFESFSIQGLFINICALYWQRDGKLSIDEINKRYKSPIELKELTDRFISVSDGFISVSFLDEQLIQAEHISKTNSKNGSLGGRPKATAKRPLSEKKQIRIRKEGDKKREENNKENNASLIPLTEQLKIFNTENAGKYSTEMLNAFYTYWNAKIINGKQSEIGKPRWQTERTWDLSGRLATWHKKEPFQTKTQERIIPKLINSDRIK